MITTISGNEALAGSRLRCQHGLRLKQCENCQRESVGMAALDILYAVDQCKHCQYSVVSVSKVCENCGRENY